MRLRSHVVLASVLTAVSAASAWAQPGPQGPGVAASAAELRGRLNAFCLAMDRAYNDESAEFYDAYREAYELLQVAKKIEGLAAGGPPGSIEKALAEIDGEIHHVEHHLQEFAARPGGSAAAKRAAGESFEAAEAALTEFMGRLRVAPAGHAEHAGHDHGGPGPVVQADPFAENVDRGRLAAVAAQLREGTNGLCTAFYDGFDDQSRDFNAAYRAAYGLLRSAKRVDAAVRAGAPTAAIAEPLSQLDADLHGVEAGLAAFVAARPAPDATKAEIAGRFEAVEATVHTLLAMLGVQRRHLDADARDREVEAAARANDAAALARGLSTAAVSLARAIEHNYKENPDFEEAHGEAVEFRDACARIAGLVRGDDVPPEARRLLAGLDGEIHHLEEHVTGFVPDDLDEKAGVGRALRKLEEVELPLHALMRRAGVERKHHD